MPWTRNVSTVSQSRTGNAKCNCQGAAKHSGKHSSQNKMACYLSFLSLSFIKKYLHNFCSRHLPPHTLYNVHLTTVNVTNIQGWPLGFSVFLTLPKKEREHGSGIPSICNILSSICCLIGSISSLLFTGIMTSCFI